MSETVTCIIPVRNGEKTIERAIESAYAAGCDYVSTYDDSSIDNTYDILLTLSRKFPSLDICASGTPVRTGVNFARNFMISRALDGLIIPLDCDDTLHDIKRLKTACGANTWVYGNYREIDGQNETIIKGSHAGVLPRKELTGITFMFWKSDWEKCGGFNPNYAFLEDYAMQCNLVHHGISPIYVDTILYDRYLKPEGNERTALSREYWSFYRQMCRRDYPLAFVGSG